MFESFLKGVAESLGKTLVVGIAGWILISSSWWNEQIVPMARRNQQPPVVPNLPDLIGYLESAKTRAESRGRAARTVLATGGAGGDLLKGEGLYGAAKERHNEAIGFLSTALVRRFQASDEPKIETLLSTARDSAERFIAWCDEVGPQQFESSPVEDLVKLVIAFKTIAAEENSEALKILDVKLMSLKWAAWEELAPAPDEPVRRKALRPLPRSSDGPVPPPSDRRRPTATPAPWFDDDPALPVVVPRLLVPCLPRREHGGHVSTVAIHF